MALTTYPGKHTDAVNDYVAGHLKFASRVQSTEQVYVFAGQSMHAVYAFASFVALPTAVSVPAAQA